VLGVVVPIPTLPLAATLIRSVIVPPVVVVRKISAALLCAPESRYNCPGKPEVFPQNCIAAPFGEAVSGPLVAVKRNPALLLLRLMSRGTFTPLSVIRMLP